MDSRASLVIRAKLTARADIREQVTLGQPLAMDRVFTGATLFKIQHTLSNTQNRLNKAEEDAAAEADKKHFSSSFSYDR